MDKPARRQGDPSKIRNTQTIEATGTYNIWYNKWSGLDRDYKSIERAEARCNIARDSGRTRAKGKAAFCLHFSHGTCVKGDKCSFYHRLPTAQDSFPITLDVFGREKHRTERDDMSGVGSFEREGKVLYVGNIANSPDAEKIVAKHFGEFGEIEHIRFLTGRGTAFVRYRHRANAEFAKEAMLGQALEHNEILNVKWAADDPNAFVKEYKKRKAEEVVKKAILAKLPQIGDQGTVLDYQNAYDDPDKKARRIEGGEHYPFYQDGQAQDPQAAEALQKQWAEYYANGGTPEAAAAYYAQTDPNAYAAFASAQATQPSEDEYERAKYGYSQESYEAASAPPTQAVESVDYTHLETTNESYAFPSGEQEVVEENGGGLVAYGSDDEED